MNPPAQSPARLPERLELDAYLRDEYVVDGYDNLFVAHHGIGSKEQHRAFAAELVRRYNAHEEMYSLIELIAGLDDREHAKLLWPITTARDIVSRLATHRP